MIDHLKRLTDGIVNRTTSAADMFGSYPEIFQALESLSPEQFEENWQSEFTHARAGYRRLVHKNPHEVITGEKVINAAKRLRPVLDHYLGPKPTDGKTTNHYTVNNINGDQNMGDKISIGGNVTASAVGSNAKLKADNIVTQIQQSGLLGDDIAKAFTSAAAALDALNAPEGTKEDVADDLEKLKKELEKQTKDEGRIKTIWDRINGVASTVATALAAAASIAKIVTGTP